MIDQLIGNVDSISARHVEGWAAARRGAQWIPAEGLQLVFGEEALEHPQRIERPDVEKSLQCTGVFGFRFVLSGAARRDLAGKRFELVDSKTGIALTAGVMRLPVMGSVVNVDVGDTLVFLAHNAHVSGIQRVVIEVLRCLRQSSRVRVRVVAGQLDGAGYVAVPDGAWERLMDAFDDGDGSVCSVARDLLEELLNRPLVRPESEQSLVVLGSPWVSEDYFRNYAPWFQSKARVIALVYDLIPISSPEYVAPGLSEVFRDVIQSYALATDGVMAISEFSRQSYLEYVAASRITEQPTCTIRLASALAGLGAGRDLDGSEDGSLTTSPEGEYVLLVSTIEPRKGHAQIIRAWQKLIDEFGAHRVPDLVFVGRWGWLAEGVAQDLQRTHFLGGKVRVLTNVDDAALVDLYRGAAFTVYPSFAEGWGLPVGESLALGTPVLASDSSSIPEVGGDFAAYFRSGDDDDLLSKLRNWLESPDELAKWRSRACEYAPDTWRVIAQRVLDFVMEVQKGAKGQVVVPLGEEVAFGNPWPLRHEASSLAAKWRFELGDSRLLSEGRLSPDARVKGALLLASTQHWREPGGAWIPVGTTTLEFAINRAGLQTLDFWFGTIEEAPVLVSLEANGRTHDAWVMGEMPLAVPVEVRSDHLVAVSLSVRRLESMEDQRPLGVMLRALQVRGADPSQHRCRCATNNILDMLNWQSIGEA